MNWSSVLRAAIAFGCLAGCAGYESVDAKAAAEAPEAAAGAATRALAGADTGVPEADDEVASEADVEEYRISVEIPVDDVTIDRGENLDVDALLDERTAFAAADFHLREVVLIARSRRGGSAELLVDDWASGAVDIPEGDAVSWYEVRIPAADVGEAGVDWVVDFTGALDLNLLVAILEPRSALIAEAAATVREVAVVENAEPVDADAVAVGVAGGEVVHAVEVVDSAPATQTVVKEVAVVEQPVYRTETVYRYVDRPVYSYRVSWIYDPARYYVFRDYGGWTYRYFPGTWDWRCYNLSYRLPSHHHHRDRHRHRADRHDGRRFDRRDRDDRRGDRDRRRGDDRDTRRRRDGDDRDRDTRGVRPRGSETWAVVSRPSALWRRVDPGHPRARLATQRRAEPRVDEGRPTNPRLRASQQRASQREPQPSSTNRVTDRRVQAAERPTTPRLNPFQRRDSGVATSPRPNVTRPPHVEDTDDRGANADSGATVRNARTRSFERRDARREEPRATVTRTPRRTVQERPTVDNRAPPSELRRERFERRPEQRAPTRTEAPRTASVRRPPVLREDDSRTNRNASRANPRTQVFQRGTERRTAATTAPRPVERRSIESRRPASSTAVQRRPAAVERSQGNARTRAFQRRSEPRVVERPRARTEPPRVQNRPRANPPRQTSSAPARRQGVAPSRSAPQPNRPVQRAPAKPQTSDSGSDARSDEGKRSNARTRAFERR